MTTLIPASSKKRQIVRRWRPNHRYPQQHFRKKGDPPRMRRKPINIRLVSLLVLLVACAQIALAEGAGSDHRPGFLPAYDKSQETAFTGTIAQVVPHPSTHSLIGMHMMVVSANGMRDVHLGSFVPKDVLENVLRTNTSVQVIGMNTTLRGQQVVLARQIITG